MLALLLRRLLLVPPMLVGICLMVFLVTYVVPNFATLYASMQAKLPTATEILIAVGTTAKNYILALFQEAGLEPQVGYRSRSLEMVRGLIGHGLGYGLLATKPANNVTYDGRALVARPLAGAVKNSRLVLATLRGRPMSAIAQEFAEHCRALFGLSQTHRQETVRPSRGYAPGDAQS